MEKKNGFFAEVIRGLSPVRTRSRSRSRSRSVSPAFRRRKDSFDPESLVARSSSLRTLTPLMEGPDPDGEEIGGSRRVRSGFGFGEWVKGQLSRNPSVGVDENGFGSKTSDLRLLLGVMGAPLAPVHVSTAEPLPHLSIKATPIETSSAQYILQQYTAACGGVKVQSSIKNAYAMGKLKMVTCEHETATKVVKNKNAARAADSGGFVLWQMNPHMWYVELAVGGSKVRAGCNGKLVWRHTPWLGSHTAKGPVRPLRRALQGLDPRTTACNFADAICIGEKIMGGEECFILKVTADHQTLQARSEGAAEIIRHVLFGYFSQKTGLLIHMEDSHLTRIQSTGGDAVYWETTINSSLDDYRPVEGVMIAHSGHSVVTLFRFGEMALSHTKTRMEEAWTIEEVAFNVPGLSLDCFIPPADLRSNSISEASELPLPQEEKGTSLAVNAHSAKVAALGNNHHDHSSNIVWKVEI